MTHNLTLTSQAYIQLPDLDDLHCVRLIRNRRSDVILARRKSRTHVDHGRTRLKNTLLWTNERLGDG